MVERARDWLEQAESDLSSAMEMVRAAHFEWACFISQQAAEKAVKALHHCFRLDPWGHVVSKLLSQLPVAVSEELTHAAKVLDLYYVSARYPDGFASGAPRDHFSARQAQEAVEFARSIVDFVKANAA